MPEDVQGVPADSPQPDVSTAPSAEPAQPSGEGTPSPTQPVAEEARIPLSRLNEVIEQRKAAEAREARLLEALQRVQTPAQPSAPQVDPWVGLVDHVDPATAQFWQMQRRLMQHERNQARQEAIQELGPVIEAGRAEIARLNTKDFRKENPDIKPGSEEERLVVAYMSGSMDGVRHPLESAKRNALYDRLEAENRALKGKQTAVPQKAAANTEASAGIPESSGLPARPRDWRQRAGEAFDRGGSLTEIANAVLGKKRK